MKNAALPSGWMAVARIVVGIMFLFFAEYKLVGHEFAHGGYEKYVSGFVQATCVSFYKPFLLQTLKHPVASGYAVAVAELLIGLSMLFGYLVRPFAILGALFMLNLTLASWNLPAGTPAWRYFGNELDNIPLMMLFVLFAVHNAGARLGLDKG